MYNPYAEESDFTNSLQKAFTSIRGASGGTSAPTAPSPLSMSPEAATGYFDQSYQRGAGFFGGTDAKASQDYRNSLGLVQDQYNAVPDAYDVSGTLGASARARQGNLMVGQQAANTAGQRYQDAQQTSQYKGVGGDLIRAQSLLPFLQSDAAGALEEGKYADTAKQKAVDAASGIAATLAKLQGDYTNYLANANSQRANFALGYAGQQTGLAVGQANQNTQNQLGLYKSEADRAEQARQANLAAILARQKLDVESATKARDQQLQSSSASSSAKPPSGFWTTDNYGRVTSGQADYNRYQDYLRSRSY